MVEASWGQWIVSAFAVVLAYWMYKSDQEESKQQKEKKEHEKTLFDNVIYLTTTRVKFERHLERILDYVASYKLQQVIITDEKEIPQSVLLPYAEYKILQECYDKQEAMELAPLIEERMKNHTNQDNSISHQEMMHRIDEKRAKRKKDEHAWQNTALKASKDEAYTKESRDIV